MTVKRGQFKVHAITLANPEGETTDISSAVGQIDLYESIFDTFCTGTLRVFDGLNLLERFRIFGQEYINIELSQYEGANEEAPIEYTIRKNFRISKIEAGEKTSSMQNTYLVHLVDPRLYFTRKARLSTIYRGAISDMIANLCLDKAHISKEEFDLFEESKPDNLSYVIPNKTVHETIQYLTREAMTMDTAAVWANPFFFYETLNGGFRFCTIDTMLQQSYPLEFTYNLARTADVNSDETLLEDKEKGVNTQILSVEYKKRFDTVEGMVMGLYAGRKNSYDMVSKISKEVIYDMNEVYARNPEGHLSGYPMVRTQDEFEKVVKGLPVVDEDTPPDFAEIDIDTNLTKSYDAYYTLSHDMAHRYDNKDTYADDEVFKEADFNSNSSESFERNALEKLLHQNITRITIPGRTDISCGLVMHANIPLIQVDDNIIKNPFDDQQYLITGIKYEFKIASKESFCHVECVKESLAKNIEDASLEVSDGYRG